MEGIDYSQYKSWQTIVAPTGATYYIVPGTGYVYDPFLSSSKGRPVLFQNPTPQVEEKRKLDKEKEKQLKAAEEAASPMGQLLPVAGTVGGLVAANKLSGWLSGTGDAAAQTAGAATQAGTGAAPQAGTWLSRQVDAVGEALGLGGGAPEAAQGVQAATTPAATTAAETFAQAATPATQTIASGASVPAGYTAVGTAADGGTMIAPTSSLTGTPPAAGLGVTPYLGAAGAALGAYGLYEGLKAKDPVSSGVGGAGLGAGLAMAAPLAGFGPLGWGAIGLSALGGGLLGGGLGAVAKMGDKDQWKTEGKRVNKLREQGVYVPEQFTPTLTKGRSKEELIELERQRPDGNVKFAESRKEEDLRPQDIVGYMAFAERDPQWFKKPLSEQLKIAQQALQAGAVREHKGTIDVDWNKVPELNPMTPPTTPQEQAAVMRSDGMAQPRMGQIQPQTGGPLMTPGSNFTPPRPGQPNVMPQPAQPKATPNQWYIDQAVQGIKDTSQPGKQWYIDQAAQGIKDPGVRGGQWYMDEAVQRANTLKQGQQLAKKMNTSSSSKSKKK